MEIKAEVEGKFYKLDFKIFILISFMFVLFIVLSFTIFSMIGFLFIQGEERKPQAVRYSNIICENLRFHATFEMECQRVGQNKFPGLECVTKIRPTEPNFFGPCVICQVECAH